MGNNLRRRFQQPIERRGIISFLTTHTLTCSLPMSVPVVSPLNIPQLQSVSSSSASASACNLSVADTLSCYLSSRAFLDEGSDSTVWWQVRAYIIYTGFRLLTFCSKTSSRFLPLQDWLCSTTRGVHERSRIVETMLCDSLLVPLGCGHEVSFVILL
jgi:hypothetical protein